MMSIYLRNVVGLFGLTLCLLLGGAGCLQTAETPSGSPSSPTLPPMPAGPEPTGTLYQGAGVTPPEDNRAFSLPNMSWYSSEDGRGFYIPGSRILSYYDLESRRLTPLCAQSGCMHVDETCGAWLGEDVRGFLTYDGDWYVLSSENSGAVICQIDPQTREKRVLCAFTPREESEFYYYQSGYAAHGYAYLWLSHNWMENGTYQSERNLVRVDLSDGSAETLPLDGETIFAGASGDYGSYLQEEMERAEAEGTAQLRVYTFDLSDYRVVAEGDVWISSTQMLTRYGDYSLYAVGDTLHIYDLTTGESRAIQAPGKLTNFLIVDGTAIYLVRDPELKVYAIALEGGESYLLEDRTGQSSVAFSISGECADAFYGIYGDGEPVVRGWLLKEDYYAGRYDRIVSTG